MSSVAIVTGSAQNLGRVIVLTLAEAGHNVIVNARTDIDAAEDTAAAARKMGVSATAVLADVTEPLQVDRLVDAAQELGTLKVLVNNAAFRNRVPICELTVSDWHAARTVTLDGAMYCTLAALPLLRACGEGRVITMIGANALRGDPSRVHVSAAKHGLIGMTKALAVACADDGLTANAISPGKLNPVGASHAERQRRRTLVAEAVVYLASDSAAGITGQIIDVGPTS